jgi:DNA topoisomerase VI subunit A
MQESITELNRAYLRDKGLTEKGVEEASAVLAQLVQVMVGSLEAHPRPTSILHVRNSGGIELHKTREAIVLGSAETNKE